MKVKETNLQWVEMSQISFSAWQVANSYTIAVHKKKTRVFIKKLVMLRPLCSHHDTNIMSNYNNWVWMNGATMLDQDNGKSKRSQ